MDRHNLADPPHGASLILALHLPLCLNLQKCTMMLRPCTLAVSDEYEKKRAQLKAGGRCESGPARIQLG